MRKMLEAVVFLMVSVFILPVIVFGWLLGGLLDIIDGRNPFCKTSCCGHLITRICECLELS